MRDQKKYPARGDVLTRLGCTRVVQQVKTNDRGTLTHVVYTGQDPESEAQESTISSWRAWTKQDCSVLPSDVQLAANWRIVNDHVGCGGVVVVYRGEVTGWVDSLRNPEHWIAGCVAVDEAGQRWEAIAGNNDDGALMWLPLTDPDQDNPPTEIP